MTREELKRQVSDGGKHFIDEMDSFVYSKKWFDTQTFVDNMRVERLIHEIDFYNKELDKWLESGMTKDMYRDLAHGYYCCIEGMLYVLRYVGYFKPDKYGDINPFIDYCCDCWFERCQIDFGEYEQIRSFFEES